MNRLTRSSVRPEAPASWLLLFLLVAQFAGAATWQPVGPGATPGEPIVSLTIHPGSPGTVWLGMPHGALYRSRDRGERWTWVGRPFGNDTVRAIDADRALAGRLFVATSGGVYRTDDGGTRWTRVSEPGFAALLGSHQPDNLAATPEALYLSAGPRLLVSLDGGRSFEVRFVAAPDSGLLFATDPSRPGRIYLSHRAEGTSHLRKSLDFGRSWSVIAAPSSTNQTSPSLLAAVGGVVYAGWRGEAAGLWSSRDGGATWRRLLDGDVSLLRIHPLKPRALYAIGSSSNGTPALMISRDGGVRWKALASVYLEHLAVDPSDGTLYGSDDYKFTRSSDGKVWETVFVPPSLEWAEVARLSFRPDHPRHLALTVGGRLYRSFDGGASWSWRGGGFLGAVALDGDDPNRLVAVRTGSSGAALLSEDGGRTWRVTSDLENGEGLVRSDRNTLFAIGCGIARSTDDGASWQKVLRCHSSDTDELAKRWTAKLDVDPLRPDRVYALSFEARLDSLPHGPLNGAPSFLWRSEDGGTTWRRISSNLDAFALERGTGTLYILRGSKLLASDDAGRTWRILGSSPGGLDLIADPENPGALYAIGYTSLQGSPDRGTTWHTVGAGGGWVLQFDPASSKTLLTATDRGIYRLSLP